MRKLLYYLFCVVFVLSFCVAAQIQSSEAKTVTPQTNSCWVYFGTHAGIFTDTMKDANVLPSEGLYVGRYHPKDGSVSDVRLAAAMKSSGFFAFNPAKTVMYIAGSRNDTDGPSNLYAYRVDQATGNLQYLNHVDSGGKGACHVDVSPDGRYVATANYSAGNFSVFQVKDSGGIGPLTGQVARTGKGPNERRQDGPKGHSVYFVKHNDIDRVLMVDLGADRVYVQRLNPVTGVLSDDPEIPVLYAPAGSGPRHLTWTTNKNGDLVVFVLNELGSTMSAFVLPFGKGKSDGKPVQTWSTLPEAARNGYVDDSKLLNGKEYRFANKTAEIEFRSFGSRDMVYASNRGDNTIAVFDVTGLTRKAAASEVELVQWQPTFGTFPRFFTTDPGGRFLLVSNKRSGTIYTMSIDQKSGKLDVVNRVPLRLSYVICIGFVPATSM
ncbi:MAG: lactonase family protein [Thermoguttaceae bacterium]|nr:lactonase family protein [Thermoguttaceae bacterium]